jgi:2-dehydropantoate 2-reductase
MRIIIFGAGAIGCLVGGHLWRSGTDMVLVGRQVQIQTINKCGLKLITPSCEYLLRVPAVTDLKRINVNSDDVIFLCVKAPDTEKATLELKSSIKDLPVFCLQNGVQNEGTAAQYFSRVFGAMIRVGAEYLNNGEIIARSDPPGLIILGRYPHGLDSLVEEVAQRLRAASFLVQVSEEIMAYKWGKLRSNLENIVHAITNTTNAETELIARAAKHELDVLLKEANIHFISQAEVAQRWPYITTPEHFDINRRIRNSTWQSLTRRPDSVETEFLNGEVVRLAARLGRQAPINDKLVRISREMANHHEQPGRYMPRELALMLGLEPPTG